VVCIVLIDISAFMPISSNRSFRPSRTNLHPSVAYGSDRDKSFQYIIIEKNLKRFSFYVSILIMIFFLYH
jgi:hypothetical protein